LIILDTHIWIWWVHGSDALLQAHLNFIEESNKLGVSIISCWEVAKLVEYSRLTLPVTLKELMEQATNYPNIQLLPLTPEIAVESTQLPDSFHRDPADQIITATARIHDITLVTQDKKLIDYPHVKTA